LNVPSVSRGTSAFHEESPPAQVNRGRDECFVHRDRRVAVPPDARLVAERLLDRLPQADADILDRVVGVDVQVALRLHGEVDQAVLGE
jgi:hypothetical protein